MSAFGIYFGHETVNLVETKGKKIANNIQISLSTLSGDGLEEKVPDEIKVVAMLKDELRKKGITVREAAICISGKDWIIRTFELPSLPRRELTNSVNFEVRRYIPFKVDELVSDFEIRPDRLSRKNLVLFMGIKKEIINKYLSIISQLDIQAKSVEYSGFTILRLIKLGGIREKGIIGVFSVDFADNEEANFTVLEDGFPLFSRDITLSGKPGSFASQGELTAETITEKFKTEIRISLDYYDRTFHAKTIARVFFLSGADRIPELESFMKEIGHTAQFLDTAKIIGTQIPFSLSLIKGYSVSLGNAVKTNLKIDLLAAKNKAKVLKAKHVILEGLPLLVGFKVEPAVLVGGLLICLATLVSGNFRTKPLRQELSQAIATRPVVSGVSASASNEELLKIESRYKDKIAALDSLIKKQMFFTELLSVIPKITTEGMLLNAYSVNKEGGKSDLTLKGMVCLNDNDKEFQSVNNFLSSLKDNNIYAKYFEKINIVSLNTKSDEKSKNSFTSFEIYGLTQKGKEK